MTTTTLILEDNVLESSHHHLLLPTNKVSLLSSLFVWGLETDGVTIDS